MKQAVREKVHVSPRPAEALVALRAVGGDLDEVTFQIPDEAGLQAVEPFVGAGKAADVPHLGGIHNTLDGEHFDGLVARNFRIAEAHIGERGEKFVLALSCDEGERCLGGAVVFVEELAVHQDFRMADGDAGALFRPDLEAHDARKVLPEIVDSAARALPRADGHKRFLRTHKGAEVRQKLGRFARIELHGEILPLFLPKVDGLAVVEVGKADGAVQGHAPALVRRDDGAVERKLC